MKFHRKRTLLMVLLLLAYAGGGAIINVAVAWGCSVLIDPFARNASFGIDEAWIGWTWRQIGAVRKAGGELPKTVQIPARLDDAGTPSLASFPPLIAHSIEESVGIPFLSMKGSRGTFGMPLSQRFRGDPTNWELPFRPLWPGFAINTIFYAAILWLLFAAPGRIRRIIRGRRGQCPACAYPIRGRTNDVCTECGAAVTAQG